MTTTDQNPILIDIPLPIVTPRLILRPPQAGDGPAMFAAKEESWDHITQWMPWAKERTSIEQDEMVARELHIKYLKREDFTMFGFARDDGRFMLGSGLHRFDWQTRRFEIGYWVRSSEHGKGYAPEAANALTRYAFAVLGAKVVTIDFADGNAKSLRVIEKLGFEKEGTSKLGIILPDGRQVDRHHYSRTDIHGLPDLDVSWG